MCIEARPIKKAKKKGIKSRKEKFSSVIFSKEAPAITGIAKRNENLKAFSLLIPSKIPVEVVEPALEIPGIKARACEMPIKTESLREIFCFLLFSLEEAKTKNNPEIAKPKPITTKLEKYLSIRALRKKPIIAAGIVATTKSKTNLKFSV